MENNPAPRERKRRSGWDLENPAVNSDAGVKRAAIALPQQAQPTSTIVPNANITAPQINSLNLLPNLGANLLLQQTLIAQQQNIRAAMANRPSCRIYVGSINYDLREADIVALFSACGKIVKSEMTLDPITKRSKGYCFLEFEEPAAAEIAMSMNGLEVAGRKIKVGRPFHGEGAVAPPGANPLGVSVDINALNSFQIPNVLNPQLAALAGLTSVQIGNPLLGLTNSAALTATAAAATSNQTLLPLQVNQVHVSKIKRDLSIEEVKALFSIYGSITSHKVIRSQKEEPALHYDLLLEFLGPNVQVATAAAKAMNNYIIGGRTVIGVETVTQDQVTRLLLDQISEPLPECKHVWLENMVTFEDTKDPTLKEEIEEEASKYGTLVQVIIVIIDSNGTDAGKSAIIKLQYEKASEALHAFKTMQGRMFDGRKIQASLAVV